MYWACFSGFSYPFCFPSICLPLSTIWSYALRERYLFCDLSVPAFNANAGIALPALQSKSSVITAILLHADNFVLWSNPCLCFFPDSPRRLWWYHWLCWAFSMVGMFCILLAHDHYTVDVVVAYYITTRLFWWYHTMANQQVSFSCSPHPCCSACRRVAMGERRRVAISLSAGVGAGLSMSSGVSLNPSHPVGFAGKKRHHRLGSSCVLTTKNHLQAGQPLCFRCITSFF